MLEITEREVQDRLTFDNPWWEDDEGIQGLYRDYPRRFYFQPFLSLLQNSSVRRALILLGPRRVGKTVMIYQSIQHLLEQEISRDHILYLSLETPIYTGISLEKIVLMFRNRFAHGRDARLFIFFDEIQYLKDWEVHLKSLVDSYPTIRFVATGSAAAALKVKSRESGAGRFTDFQLPPLSFAEYLNFIGADKRLISPADPPAPLQIQTSDIDGLNRAYVDYLNFGGYPEAVFVEAIRSESVRYIKSDIIDKVLLRDLPSLYGINDIQELNRLFTVLAYNTGNEVSYEGLTKSSGVAKNTVKKYLEYLEAAFLIRSLYPLNRDAQRFQRVSRFKVYLTNPSMRAALFGSVTENSEVMGALNETALVSHWLYNEGSLPAYYARWSEGEIDLVGVDRATRKPLQCMEIKWSDRPHAHSGELRNLTDFAKQHIKPLFVPTVEVTTRTIVDQGNVYDTPILFTPSSLRCYMLGKLPGTRI